MRIKHKKGILQTNQLSVVSCQFPPFLWQAAAQGLQKGFQPKKKAKAKAKKAKDASPEVVAS